jgi:DNA-directed RNA polymerase subunit RPC12/RpoP
MAQENREDLGGRKMSDVECLACGKPVKLPQFIDTDSYDGQVVCKKCGALLYVKFAKGKVQKYRIVDRKFRGFDFTKLIVKYDEEQKKQEKSA